MMCKQITEVNKMNNMRDIVAKYMESFPTKKAELPYGICHERPVDYKFGQ